MWVNWRIAGFAKGSEVAVGTINGIQEVVKEAFIRVITFDNNR
jgi:hypothetical protein